MTPQPNSTRCPHGQGFSIFCAMLARETDDCITWPYKKSGNGYGVVGLGGPERNERREYTHRLAFVMEHKTRIENLQVLHRCDNPPCFNPRHLFSGTAQDNKNDERAKGRTLTGVKNPMAKLTENQVREIRTLYKDRVNGFGQQALAKRFGITRIAVRKIVKGTAWKHLLEE